MLAYKEYQLTVLVWVQVSDTVFAWCRPLQWYCCADSVKSEPCCTTTTCKADSLLCLSTRTSCIGVYLLPGFAVTVYMLCVVDGYMVGRWVGGT